MLRAPPLSDKLCTHNGRNEAKAENVSINAFQCFISKRAEEDVWTTRKTYVITHTYNEIHQWPLHLRHQRLQRPGRVRSVTRPDQSQNQTGWILVLVSEQSRAGVQQSMIRTSRNSVICADVTSLIQRHVFYNPNIPWLAKMKMILEDTTGWLARWRHRLSKFEFDIIHHAVLKIRPPIPYSIYKWPVRTPNPLKLTYQSLWLTENKCRNQEAPWK